jgi:hypothetical protein
MQKAFEKKLIEKSENDSFIEACKEWLCVDFEEGNNYCVCGQKIKNLYKIKNKINNNIIYPVGCECVKNARGLQESMKDIKHKKNKNNAHLYCKWCGDRHRNRSPVCNICKSGEYLITFGKYREHSLNYIYKKNPGYFEFIKEKASHRYCGRLKRFYEIKVKN